MKSSNLERDKKNRQDNQRCKRFFRLPKEIDDTAIKLY